MKFNDMADFTMSEYEQALRRAEAMMERRERRWRELVEFLADKDTVEVKS